MSIHDRDWYREEMRRRTRSARSPATSESGYRLFSGLMVVAIVVIALVLVVKKVGGHSTRQNEGPNEGRRPVAASPSRAPPPRSADERGEPSSPPKMLYRCVVDGQLVYSGPVDCGTAGAVAEGHRSPAPPPRSSSTFTPETPALTPYQRQMLESANARIARDEARARAEMAQLRPAPNAASSECRALDETLRAIDASSRLPQSAFGQDQLRLQRQRVTSRQRELRC